jgi:hypothetical protein
MDARLREFVRVRAGNRCEYCLVPQAGIKLALHIEHIVAVQHAGGDAKNNLALACDRCNLYKGTNLSGVDSESGDVARLFHPRTDDWNEHFALAGCEIIGLTPAGRATARLLRFNSSSRVQLRSALIQNDQW